MRLKTKPTRIPTTLTTSFATMIRTPATSPSTTLRRALRAISKVMSNLPMTKKSKAKVRTIFSIIYFRRVEDAVNVILLTRDEKDEDRETLAARGDGDDDGSTLVGNYIWVCAGLEASSRRDALEGGTGVVDVSSELVEKRSGLGSGNVARVDHRFYQ